MQDSSASLCVTQETSSSWTDDHLAESLNDTHQPSAPQLSLDPAFLQGQERPGPAMHQDSAPANASHHMPGKRSGDQPATAPAAPRTSAGSGPGIPDAPSDEVRRLSRALAESEQRVVGIEVALSSMQKAHFEAVEHAARLQVTLFSCTPPE